MIMCFACHFCSPRTGFDSFLCSIVVYRRSIYTLLCTENEMVDTSNRTIGHFQDARLADEGSIVSMHGVELSMVRG